MAGKDWLRQHAGIARRKLSLTIAIIVLTVILSVFTFGGFAPADDFAGLMKIVGLPAWVICGLKYLDVLKDEVISATKSVP